MSYYAWLQSVRRQANVAHDDSTLPPHPDGRPCHARSRGACPIYRMERLLDEADRLDPNESSHSSDLSETCDPAAWGNPNREVRIVGGGIKPFSFPDDARIKDFKRQIYDAAIANCKRQKNYETIDGRHFLRIGKRLVEITMSGVKHGLDRRWKVNGCAAALVGDLLNNSVEVPDVKPPMHFYVAKMDIGSTCYVLVSTRDSERYGEIQEISVLHSVNAKTDGTAQGFVLTNATRPAQTEIAVQGSIPTAALRPSKVSISQLRAAWEGLFLPGIKKHNVGKQESRAMQSSASSCSVRMA